jgi:protein TonB
MKILQFLLSMLLVFALVTSCNTPPAETVSEEAPESAEYAEGADNGDADAMDDGEVAMQAADGDDMEVPPEAEGIGEEEFFTNEETGEVIYNFLPDSDKPTFNGDMGEFLQSTIEYPEESRENGNEGTIIVDFIVGTDGYVKDAHVIKPHEDVLLNNEAIRVVNSMPQWNPAVKDGQPVAFKYVLPIHFKLMK